MANKRQAAVAFALLGIGSDNGGEFINTHLLRYCQAERLAFTGCHTYRHCTSRSHAALD